MKLAEIVTLTENYTDFVVYKVSAPTTEQVYYGYSMGDDIKKAFMVGANRQDNPDRGDVRMVNIAGGEENLKFDMIDVFANEIEAFVERNDLRARDSASITGPSRFPGQVYQRALKDYPEHAARWKMDRDQNNMTAKDAYAAGAFDYATLQNIVGGNAKLKKDLTNDLNRMMYPEFKAKYLTGV